MSRRFLTPLDLVQNELRNAVVQNLAADPVNPVPGQIYFNSATGSLLFHDGTAWVKTSIPTGPAGGDLEGSYPNPTIAAAIKAVINGAEQSANKNAANGYAGLDASSKIPLPYLPVTDSGVVSDTKVVRADDSRLSDPREAKPGSVRDSHVASDAAIAYAKLAAPVGPTSFGSQRLTNLADPTAATDAANKRYVDSLSQGLDFKASVRLATTGNLATTYANGSSGVGATLTSSTNAPLSLDGVTAAVGDRVLVKNQTTAAQNGVYVVSAAGSTSVPWVLTRSEDADTGGELNAGAVTYIAEGQVHARQLWVMTTPGAITLGTSDITWTQFGAMPTPLGAGQGLTNDGTAYNVGAGTGILSNADDVAIDPAVVVRKAAVTLAGGATSEVITHNLNSRDVTVAVYNNVSPFDEVFVDVEHTTTNTITVRAAQALPAGYRVVVHG